VACQRQEDLVVKSISLHVTSVRLAVAMITLAGAALGAGSGAALAASHASSHDTRQASSHDTSHHRASTVTIPSADLTSAAENENAPTTGTPSNCPAVGTQGFQTEPMALAHQQATAMAAKMTLAQDLTLMHGVSPNPTPDGTVGATAAIPSLGIPAVNQQDGPAGVGDGATGVTQLPAPVDLAATWDQSLAACYGKVVGTEERGKGVEEVYGPTINIVRVPLWGRAFEALGEDPYLDGTVAAAEVNGIQSQGEMAEVKHFAVYNQETNRNTPEDDAIVSERTTQEIYIPAWANVIQNSNPAAIMCAYSSINGQFACQNSYLLNNVLDTQLGYQGFVGSDYSATHSTVASANAGMDQEQPETTYFAAPLAQAVRTGQVSRSTINDAVIRILTQMYRFKLFTDYPTGNMSDTVTDPADQNEGLDIAETGTTLLKNASVDGTPVLPYSTSASSVAVIGADASTAPMTDGGGSAGVVPSKVTTPLQGIRNQASGTHVSYSDGKNVAAAAKAAAAAQQAVVFVNDVESEGVDRTSLELPGNANYLIKEVAAANPRTVVVLNTGAPVLMPWLSQVAGVIEAWYPGQDDGTAIAKVLFGQVDPSGHLPDTFPANVQQQPISTKRQFPGVNGKVYYSEGLDVGYRWYNQNDVTPLFPFGYGLSYTSFRYTGLHISAVTPTGHGGPAARVTATVTNTGSVAGADVAQLYLTDPAAAGEPPRQLEGFQRVSLNPGQSQQVTFTLDARSLSYWSDAASAWVAPAGQFTAYVGDSSAPAGLPLTGTFTVAGSTGPQSVSVHAPAILPTGATTVPVTFTNDSGVTDHHTRIRLALSTGGNPLPAAGAARLIPVRSLAGGPPSIGIGQLAPGHSITVRFRADAPSDAQPGSYEFTGTATYQAGQTSLSSTNTAPAAVAFSSPAAAFNSVGVAPAHHISTGNFDGGGFSFQQQQLDADGFAPGDTVAAGGQQLTVPDVAAGQPDEITTEGQVVDVSGTGSELGFLGAGEFGTQSGPVTVRYTDGTTQKATLSLADWYADAPAPGGVIAASGPWNVPPSQTQNFGLHTVAVYYAQIPIDPAKTLAAVTLPDNPDMHLFDIGVPTPANSPSVDAAMDDTGLTAPGYPLAANYDGGGYSFDAKALAAAGLTPGASVTAQGVTFSWPDYAPGRFDNIKAEGQTVAFTGSGTVLGFLGAGANGTQTGTVTINYTDGTTQTATLSFADWYADTAAPGGTIVATVPWNDAPGSTLGAHQVSIYSATVPLTPGKTIASLTLPTNPNLHIFAIAPAS
jgi:beta-glucosidase